MEGWVGALIADVALTVAKRIPWEQLVAKLMSKIADDPGVTEAQKRKIVEAAKAAARATPKDKANLGAWRKRLETPHPEIKEPTNEPNR